MARKKAMVKRKVPCNLVPIFAYLLEIYKMGKSTELVSVSIDAVKNVLKMLDMSRGLTRSVGHEITTGTIGRDVEFAGMLLMLGEVALSEQISISTVTHEEECQERPGTVMEEVGGLVEVTTVQRDIKFTVHITSEERKIKSINHILESIGSDLRFFAERSLGKMPCQDVRDKDELILKLARSSDEEIDIWTDAYKLSHKFTASIPRDIGDQLRGAIW